MKSLRGRHTLLAFALLIGIASCNLAITAPTAAPTLQPGDSVRNLTVTGLARDYALHIPPGLDSSRALPVVFAFHGYGGSGVNLQNATGFNVTADTGGFLVVYPNGIDHSWNAGSCCGP